MQAAALWVNSFSPPTISKKKKSKWFSLLFQIILCHEKAVLLPRDLIYGSNKFILLTVYGGFNLGMECYASVHHRGTQKWERLGGLPLEYLVRKHPLEIRKWRFYVLLEGSTAEFFLYFIVGRPSDHCGLQWTPLQYAAPMCVPSGQQGPRYIGRVWQKSSSVTLSL